MIHKMIDMTILSFAGKSLTYIKKTVLAKLVTLVGNIGFAFSLAAIWSGLLAGDLSSGSLYLIRHLVALGASLLLRHIGIRYSQYCAAVLVGEVKCSLRTALFAKLIGLGAGYARHISRAELLQTAVEGVEQLETYFGGYVPQFFFCFAADVILGLALAPFHPQAALLLGVMSPLIPLLLMLMLKKVRLVQNRYWDSYANVGRLFLDSIQGLTTLKIFGSDEEQAEKIDERAEQFRRKTMRLLSMQLNSITLINLVAYGSTAAAVILSLRSFQSGQIGLFSALLTVIIAAEFFLPMRSLTSLFHVAMTGVTVADRMKELLALPTEEAIEPVELNGKDLRIEKLHFSYEPGQPTLCDISLQAEPGRMTAIVGPSGCGKSTLSRLLTGQLRAEPGQIRIGGVDAATVSTAALYRAVTLITHNAFLFEGSVRDNLLMGNETATDEQLINVLRKVELWSLFEADCGLDSQVAAAGANLSGGQAQRLGLARGLLHDSPYYIFDEVTSSVDAESEDVIMEVIRRLAETKTVLVISHRLESVKEAGRIVVLERGRLTGIGSHQELMAAGGLYAALYLEQQQLEAYRNGGQTA